MISKELLSKVLGPQVFCISMDVPHKNMVRIFAKGYDSEDWDINIYELANKCKEWALESKNYYIWTGINHNSKWEVFVNKSHSFNIYETVDSQAVYNPIGGSSSEPEAIFNACEWILKQKD